MDVAGVVELADTQDLGSCAARCEGSSPFSGTERVYLGDAQWSRCTLVWEAFAVITGSVPSFSLSLADVLAAVDLQPAAVLLIRHPMSHPGVRQAVQTGGLLAYTSDQAETFPSCHDYWLSFLGEEGNSARLSACYRNGGRAMGRTFLLEETGILSDLAGRLVIDWGPGTRSWWQNGTSACSKPVVALTERAVTLARLTETVACWDGGRRTSTRFMEETSSSSRSSTPIRIPTAGSSSRCFRSCRATSGPRRSSHWRPSTRTSC